jgi:hypothetical protein
VAGLLTESGKPDLVSELLVKLLLLMLDLANSLDLN